MKASWRLWGCWSYFRFSTANDSTQYVLVTALIEEPLPVCSRRSFTTGAAWCERSQFECFRLRIGHCSGSASKVKTAVLVCRKKIKKKPPKHQEIRIISPREICTILDSRRLVGGRCSSRRLFRLEPPPGRAGAPSRNPLQNPPDYDTDSVRTRQRRCLRLDFVLIALYCLPPD